MTALVSDVVELAGRAGTLPMQGLLLLAIIVLGSGMVWMHFDNRKMLLLFIEKMETKDGEMTSERKARIESLIKMIQDDTLAKRDVAHALQSNATAISDFKLFIREHFEDRRKT